MDDLVLLAIGELIRNEVNAGRLLQRVVEVTAEAVDAERGTVFLLDQTGAELVSIAGHVPEVAEIRVPVGVGVAGYVARTGELVNIPFRDDAARIWREAEAATRYTTRTVLAGPVYDREERVIGVLEFLNKRESLFDRLDEQRFQTLAQQVSRALHRTTLARGRDYRLPSAAGGVRTPAGLHPVNDPPLRERFNGVIGSGPAMQRVFRQIRQVAPAEATVLLRGPSGTGKGRIARALHHNSRRTRGPFVHVDCATLPEGLIEDELFGHERGAYTGAQSRQQGKVELADGGTLFLDEIGDVPVGLQSKLLTVLQDRVYSRLGGHEALRADVRIVAATHRDLEDMVAGGRFREDLYYRLRVVEIPLPTLAQRGEQDLIQLVNHFIGVFSRRYSKPIRGIREDALGMLLAHTWPGNVRELEHCIEAAVLFAEDRITPSTLSLPRRHAARELRALSPSGEPVAAPSARSAAPFDDAPSLRQLEARYIEHLLRDHDGNRSACARVLGIGRNTLARKMKEYDLTDL